MRSKHRAAVIRAFLGISVGILGVNCNLPDARADDTRVQTIEAPPPPHHFGDRGDVVIPLITGTVSSTGYTGGIGWIDFGHDVSDDGTGAHETSTNFGLSPELDVFIARHLSIGGHVSFSRSSTTDTPNVDPQTTSTTYQSTTTSASIEPRIGYALSLGDRVTLWPRVGAGILARDTEGNLSPAATPFLALASLDMPIVYAFDRHVMLSVVPEMSMSGAPQNGRYASAFSISGGTSFNFSLVL